MKRTVLLFVSLLWFVFGGHAQESKLEALLSKYKLADLEKQSFAQTPLSCADCNALVPYLIEQWKREVYDRLQEDGENKVVRYGDLTMPFEEREFGDIPEEGHSLYISLHGGGNTTKEVNDQQWKNQIDLYQPEEGIYIAPRAPWNDWNMWFKPGMDELLEDLIQWMVITREVNPNRVYLLGYSAGGDGVWRLAPRMADHWAAASMMAGHPGEAQQVNLFSLPFMIWMGANDKAYHRNLEAGKKAALLDSLEQENPLFYVHETHILPGKGHWMDRADTLAVNWMANFERDPLPYKIVWRQEEVVRSNMYWLEVDKTIARPGMRVDAVVDENEIEILRCDYPRLRIYLNDEMTELDDVVRVIYHNKVLFEGKLKRTLGNMAKTLSNRGDYYWMFPSFVDVEIKE